MRILFLTNFFPPYEIGGQERSCLEVFEGLSARGHECLILTSMHGTNNVPTEEGRIRRWLYLEMDMVPLRHGLIFFTQRKQRENNNLQILERLIADFQPDILFIWGMWNLPRSLPALAERLLPGRVAYRFAEYWPTLPSQHEMYWRAPAKNRITFLPKWIMSRIALAMLAMDRRQIPIKFEHVVCVSAGTRQVLVDAGIPVIHARVIHTGLDVQEFTNGHQPLREEENHPLKLLYAGRLSTEKGVDTVIQAMSELVKTLGRGDIHLQLAGAGQESYENELRDSARQLGLEDVVAFLGRVPSKEMPKLMQSCQVLIVPSIWPEPFARVVLEGMVSRMVVVATPTGGTGEIVTDGENGLLFPAGNSSALAQRIRSLAENPSLRIKLAEAGWQTVMQHYTKTGMLDAYEKFLFETPGLRGLGKG
jgi:glycogen synthase